MRETWGYATQARRAVVTGLSISALALGLAACGDDGGDVSLGGGGSAASGNAGDTGAAAASYRLADGGKALVDADGTRIPIDAKRVTGYVDSAQSTGEFLDMSGWAAPADLSRPADVVVAFVGRKSVASAAPSGPREDLVEGYNRPGLEKAGFVFSVPKGAMNCAAPSGGLKTFAIAGNAAAPLEWLADVGDQATAAC